MPAFTRMLSSRQYQSTSIRKPEPYISKTLKRLFVNQTYCAALHNSERNELMLCLVPGRSKGLQCRKRGSSIVWCGGLQPSSLLVWQARQRSSLLVLAGQEIRGAHKTAHHAVRCHIHTGMATTLIRTESLLRQAWVLDAVHLGR